MRASTDPFDRQVRHHRRPTWRTWSDNSLEPFFFENRPKGNKKHNKNKTKGEPMEATVAHLAEARGRKKKDKGRNDNNNKKKGNVEVVRTAHKWRLDVSRPPIFHLRSPWVTAPNLPLSLSLSHSLSLSLPAIAALFRLCLRPAPNYRKTTSLIVSFSRGRGSCSVVVVVVVVRTPRRRMTIFSINYRDDQIPRRNERRRRGSLPPPTSFFFLPRSAPRRRMRFGPTHQSGRSNVGSHFFFPFFFFFLVPTPHRRSETDRDSSVDAISGTLIQL